MKPLTLTVIMALVVAVPLLLGKRKPEVQPVKIQAQSSTDADKMYDIFDFIS